MVALTYDNLGSISGVTENPKVPGSKRSRDQNNTQRIAFSCDPKRPFTGTIHVQASVGDPNKQDQDTVWFDIAEMIIDNEGGSWSFEPEGEFSSIRVICRDGNYWSAAHGTVGGTTGTGGSFTINGITVSVVAGDGATQAAAAINSTAAIVTDGTIVADVINTSQLRIYKKDGADLVLADTINSPLGDFGITAGTFKGGVIAAIRSLR